MDASCWSVWCRVFAISSFMDSGGVWCFNCLYLIRRVLRSSHLCIPLFLYALGLFLSRGWKYDILMYIVHICFYSSILDPTLFI
jgi:hypothetical protein